MTLHQVDTQNGLPVDSDGLGSSESREQSPDSVDVNSSAGFPDPSDELTGLATLTRWSVSGSSRRGTSPVPLRRLLGLDRMNQRNSGMLYRADLWASASRPNNLVEESLDDGDDLTEHAG